MTFLYTDRSVIKKRSVLIYLTNNHLVNKDIDLKIDFTYTVCLALQLRNDMKRLVLSLIEAVLVDLGS
ncbi:hypothetical protein BpHYR1_025789 [Brachionus plicatilis]|uniref:Uncharacterized protein n=1 Tax=Brachionus plicatilis TaxID=10195 RepID=A0A3M7Q0M7_BRAPC|nr:hypothetical protein BpHYR1_025789 [Brachionus plicatilis]